MKLLPRTQSRCSSQRQILPSHQSRLPITTCIPECSKTYFSGQFSCMTYVLLTKTSRLVSILYIFIKSSTSVPWDPKDVLRMLEQSQRARKSSGTGESQQGIEGRGEQLLRYQGNPWVMKLLTVRLWLSVVMMMGQLGVKSGQPEQCTKFSKRCTVLDLSSYFKSTWRLSYIHYRQYCINTQ